MCNTPAFTALPPTLPSRAKRSTSSRFAPVFVLEKPNVCPHAPERTRTHYRVLPPNLPRHKRPPPPPHKWSVPVLGFLLETGLGLSTQERRRDKYGDIYSWHALVPTCYITKQDAITSMIKDTMLFRNTDSFKPLNHLFGETCLLTLDPPDHDRIRRSVAPAFSPALLPLYFDRVAQRTRQTWMRAAHAVKRDGRIRLMPVFYHHFLACIVEITTGIDLDSDSSSHIRELFFTLQNGLFTPPFGPVWRKAMRARAELVATLEEVIRVTMKEKADVIAKLRENSDTLGLRGFHNNGDVSVLLVCIARMGITPESDTRSIRELVDLVLFLWFAGYSTAGASTACAVMELGFDADITSQLRDEQDELTANAGGNRELTYRQVAYDMPLLDSFLWEVMRLHPAAAAAVRRLAHDAELCGHYVERGSTILFDFKSALRDSNVYNDPHRLVIDRFMGGKTPPRLLAFGGAGSPHFCVGAALARVIMKAILATMLREYNFELDPAQSRAFVRLPDETPKSKVVVRKLERRDSRS